MFRSFIVSLGLAVLFASLSWAISGSSMALNSGGTSGSTAVLNENGYVGTYITLGSTSDVTVTVNASGSAFNGINPNMNIWLGDQLIGFDVTPGSFNTYQHTFADLPAGTHFLRTEFTNDGDSSRSLVVGSVGVTGESVSSSNSNSNSNALAAADSYIENFRQGPASVALVGASPGTPVEVKMVHNAFNFGTMVQGFDADVFLAPVSPGDTTSTAARYQQFVNSHFNILVPSNMGKWQPNENTQNMPTMGQVDTILNYAQSHDMNVRMHNLIWGNQQPGWVNDLIDDAQSMNPAVAAQGKADLMDAITNRIAYYVGDGDTNDGDRSKKYREIDVLNEALREGTYWDIFGAEGIAEIYKNVLDAVNAAGANTRLYTNEYNVLQYSSDPDGGASDTYANWYRRNVEEINDAGFGDVVTGIGVQYGVDARTSNAQVHSAARIQQVMQNLSVTGLPISLTEFSVHPSTGSPPVDTSEARSAEIYDETLRMIFGTPQATSFLIWEPWPPAGTDNTTIVDDNWNLRASGQALVDLLDAWTTPTQNLAVDPNGMINFTGFYGDYEITVGGETFELDLTKGTDQYSLIVDIPPDFNDDDMVDGVDLGIWESGYGVNNSGDADGDGDTDGDDFLIWQQWAGFGAGLASPSSAAVPEPSAFIALAGVGIMGLLCRVSRGGIAPVTR